MMTTGAGIAVAAIWIAAAVICINKRVNGLGMIYALIAALFATMMACSK